MPDSRFGAPSLSQTPATMPSSQPVFTLGSDCTHSSRRSRIFTVFETLSIQPISPTTPRHRSNSKSQTPSTPVNRSPSVAGSILRKRRASTSIHTPHSNPIPISRSQSRIGLRSSFQAGTSESTPSVSRSLSLLGPFRSLRLSDEAKAARNACPPFQFPARPVSSIAGPTPSVGLGGSLLQDLNDTTSTHNCTAIANDTAVISDPEHHVLLHSEVQTGTFIFRRKKDYLVLTETHLLRFKNQYKASEYFPTIPAPHNRTSSYGRHQPSASIGSTQELQGLNDPSADKDFCLLLQHLVAVQLSDDTRLSFAIDVTYFDPSTLHAATVSLQFGTATIRDAWFTGIRMAAAKACVADPEPIPSSLIHSAARIVEAENDYDVDNFSIYKIVVAPPSRNRSSDDMSRVYSAIYFLVIGVHKVHIIPLSKLFRYVSAPALATYSSHECYGILSLTEADFGLDDDTLDLTFRVPLTKPKSLRIASLAAFDIASRIYRLESSLRRNWVHPVCLFTYNSGGASFVTQSESVPPCTLADFEKLMSAYCASYNINPANIRYKIVQLDGDGRGFELLPPATSATPNYSCLELLAIFRSLRSCELFSSISFAGVNLDDLRTLNDLHGQEHGCFHQTQTAGKVEKMALQHASLLVHEVRALVTSNQTLRSLNFDSCLGSILPPHRMLVSDRGCGIVEAVFPACAASICQVDSIVLNNITLGSEDSELIAKAVGNQTCRFKSLQLRNCGLDDKFMSMFSQRIRAQHGTLTSLDISRNVLWVTPLLFKTQFNIFHNLQSLDISNVAVGRGEEPLLPFDLLRSWSLQSLSLNGIHCNDKTIQNLVEYLQSPHSHIQDLRMNRTGLSGRDIADIMLALTASPGSYQNIHLEVGENFPEKGHEYLVDAIAVNRAPASLSMQATEYDNEEYYRKLILAIAVNKTIRYLDMAQLRLPDDASRSTCDALEYLFVHNTTLEHLDISGENSRLDDVRFGAGINDALRGLFNNTTLRSLTIEKQMLGPRGASTLADLIKANSTLRELRCSHNDFSLSGLTDIVNSLEGNTTLLYLSDMEECREHAMKMAELEVRGVDNDQAGQSSPTSSNSSTTVKLMKSSTRSVRSAVYKVAKGSVGRQPSVSSQNSNSSRISDQEVQAALQVMEESWDRQRNRLYRLLHRNQCIAMGGPVGLMTEGVSPIADGAGVVRSKHNSMSDCSSLNTTPIQYRAGGSHAVPANSPASVVDFPASPPSPSPSPSPSDSSSFEDDGLSLLATPEKIVLEVPKNSPISPPPSVRRSIPRRPPLSRATNHLSLATKDVNNTKGVNGDENGAAAAGVTAAVGALPSSPSSSPQFRLELNLGDEGELLATALSPFWNTRLDEGVVQDHHHHHHRGHKHRHHPQPPPLITK